MKFSYLLCVMVMLIISPIHAQESNSKVKEVFAATAEMSAKVKDIDYKTRKVTLENAQGKTTTVTADNSIKNLDQVKKGDTVVVGYSESLVYQIGKGGKATAPVETDVAGASRAGSNPGRMAGRQINASVLISNIDKKNQTVTFKNAKGETNTLKVSHPERLDAVKAGDTVDITYTEAVAVKLQKQDTKIQ